MNQYPPNKYRLDNGDLDYSILPPFNELSEEDQYQVMDDANKDGFDFQ